ncbi:MAG: ABC transporter ATP-binding protein [Planctomycetota bacterium]|jgi:lipopolysaccharide transport system ATP-binding protein
MNDSSDKTVLRVNNISKIYRVWNSPADRINAPLVFRLGRLAQSVSNGLGMRLMEHATSKFCDFAALSDISFELKRGESLGIIGRNGAGKSTLLQIIAGTLQPSSGTVETHGRITALLELGSGFNPEFTGRENVYLNGAILKLSRSQMDDRYEDIVRFADIGDYIEQPIKFYSSGMLARLAFAVQVHLDPDILIVDEALAVGDAEFRAKAMDKMDKILAQDVSLLYVGHDLNAVRSFCSRAMWLDKGLVVGKGDPDSVVNDYLYAVHSKKVSSSFGIHAQLEKRPDGFRMPETDIRNSSYVGGGTHKSVRYGDSLNLAFDVRVGPNLRHPYFIFDIVDQKSLQITGRRIPIPMERMRSGEGTVRIGIRANFQKGVYRLHTRIVEAPDIYNTVVVSCKNDHLSFDVVDDSRELFTGVVPVPLEISWEGRG